MKKHAPIGITLFLCTLLLFTAPASAYVGMVTGSKTGTYIQFGRDIAEIAQKHGLDIKVKESEGSLNNIQRMNSRENAAFGIVQSDVLGILYRNQPRVARKLGMIYPFYNEEVHILTRKGIRRFSDLEGKTIATGTKGSGSWLTIANLLHKMDIKPARKITDMKPLDALIAVLEGKIDAMIYVAGKPVTLFSKLEKLKNNPKYRPLIDQVHFLPLNQPTLLKEYYVASEIGPSDYPWLKKSVPTIAVKALLVCFDFSTYNTSYYTERCKQLKQLSEIIRDNLDYLKRNGHKKWQAVNLDATVGNWKRDACSHAGEPAPDSHELYDALKGLFDE